MLHESGGNAVRIADFGIAKIVGGESLYSGMTVGTFDYMSPEQAGAAPNLDRRSDQFSLAAMAHRMLTGGKRFSLEGNPEIQTRGEILRKLRRILTASLLFTVNLELFLRNLRRMEGHFAAVSRCF